MLKAEARDPIRGRINDGGPVDRSSDKLVDVADALARAGGDSVLLRELVTIFLQESPKLISEMHDSISKKDSERLIRASHTLNGQAAFFGVQSVCKLALKLETMGRRQQLTRSRQALAALETEVEQLRSALSCWGPTIGAR